jgi:hypothetical protein
MIGAIAAILGGVVVFGSNSSTSKQTTAAMKAAEIRRAELIDMVDLRTVGESGVALFEAAPRAHRGRKAEDLTGDV